MIILFGAPGSGKTEQGKMLAAKYNWEWISYRDIFLALHDEDISLALKHGMNISDEANIRALDHIFHTIERNNAWQSVVLDGFPNSTKQIYWMAEQDFVKHINGAIILRVPRGELWQRMLKRGRVDDTRAAIERRQDAYERSITGMIHTLREHNIEVGEVDGSNSPADVLERIEEKLQDWRIINSVKQ